MGLCEGPGELSCRSFLSLGEISVFWGEMLAGFGVGLGEGERGAHWCYRAPAWVGDVHF